MRRDPVFLAFKISSPTCEESLRLKERLRCQVEPDAEIIDTCASSEGTKSVHYRVGDFFEEIAIAPAEDETVGQFRLVFHRKSSAGPFWKDIMVRIVRGLETEPGVSVSLAYQGDVPLDWMRSLTARFS